MSADREQESDNVADEQFSHVELYASSAMLVSVVTPHKDFVACLGKTANIQIFFGEFVELSELI